MKKIFRFSIVFLLMSIPILACSLLSPAASTPQAGTGTAAQDATVFPTFPPEPTVAQLNLEIVKSQEWTDRDGNVRANVLVRNPYDFPVAPISGASANWMDSDGKLMAAQHLYFLDGISGGSGFLLPGETIAANACVTCERAPLSGAWGSVKYNTKVNDATGKWNYYTDVTATVTSVSFDGDSPIFDVAGTVKNNTNVTLSRLSMRVFVYDQKGNLVGAAEVSGYDVAPGASASVHGSGLGQKPSGAVKYEATALGIKY